VDRHRWLKWVRWRGHSTSHRGIVVLTHRVTLCQDTGAACGAGGASRSQHLVRAACRSGHDSRVVELEGRGVDRGRCVVRVRGLCVAMSARVFRLLHDRFVVVGTFAGRPRRRDHRIEVLGAVCGTSDLPAEAKQPLEPRAARRTGTRTVQKIWLKLRIQDPGISIKHTIFVV
jgi:hypothetical protein